MVGFGFPREQAFLSLRMPIEQPPQSTTVQKLCHWKRNDRGGFDAGCDSVGHKLLSELGNYDPALCGNENCRRIREEQILLFK